MIEHPRDIGGVIADGSRGQRIREPETGPIESNVPQPRLRGRLIRGEATAGRAMTVDHGRRGGIGIAPHRETHMPPIPELPTIRSKPRLHRRRLLD